MGQKGYKGIGASWGIGGCFWVSESVGVYWG